MLIPNLRLDLLVSKQKPSLVIYFQWILNDFLTDNLYHTGGRRPDRRLRYLIPYLFQIFGESEGFSGGLAASHRISGGLWASLPVTAPVTTP